MEVMNEKFLLTNGCSFTWGGGLEPFFQKYNDDDLNDQERLKLVWPYHLGLKMNRNPINLGMGCGSNQRTVRTTIEWLSSQSVETLNNTVAVIQWTEYFRKEYYIPTEFNDPLNYQHHSYKYNFENISDNWVLINSWGHSADGKNKKIADRFIKSSIETYSDLNEIFNHIGQCLTLAYLFEKYRIKYCFWDYEGNREFWPKEYYNLIKDLKWISENNIKDFEIISETDPHPSIKGHKQIAETIYEWFNNE